MMRRRIYMDYASTTPLAPEVFSAMKPYFSTIFGNPSAIAHEGVMAKRALDESRKNVARILQARTHEVIFTGGGTEANNLAILGVAEARARTGVTYVNMHFVTTVIEHSSILACFAELARRGAHVTYVPVAHDGRVSPETIMGSISKKTVLVSVGLVNNEIGVVQPLREIALLLQDYTSKNSATSDVTPVLHSDASQAPLYLDVSVPRLCVDLLTLDGHKMYGPKGVGVLYKRRTVTVAPLLFGGGQESGLRSTTENVPLIVGFASALTRASEQREKESVRLRTLQDFAFSLIAKEIPRAVVNGSRECRVPNNVNISIEGLNVEFTVLQLDAMGIACSTKSSCLGSDGGSYVVKALGGALADSRAHSTLRFTFGVSTKKADIVKLITALGQILAKSR